MKNIATILVFLCVIGLVVFKFQPNKESVKELVELIDTRSLIDKDSLTIKTRVNIPEGYKRVIYSKGSYQEYLRNYKLKSFGSKIINYDDSEYYWQDGHIGILDIPVPKNGLQQCADALIRIRSEYLWNTNQKEKIGFNFTSGHYCSWIKYAEGYRPKIKGNKVTFHKTTLNDHSKRNSYKYLNLIYMYSGHCLYIMNFLKLMM